jgi:anti-sigma factor RsiW
VRFEQEISDLIYAYADGELDLVSSLSVERHIQIYEDCLRAHQDIQAMRSLIHDESLYFRPSAGLRKHRVTIDTTVRLPSLARMNLYWTGWQERIRQLE